MSQRMQQRRDSAANWTSVNPVLASGEIGIETGSSPRRFKIGDGATAWNSLPYASPATASRDPYVVTNYARTQPTPYLSFGIVPFAVDPDVSGRIWASNIAFGSIGHSDDNGVTYTPRVGNPDPTTGVQSMVFSGSFVYLTISGSTSRHGSVWRSPKPASDGTGLSFTKIFDLNGLVNGPGGAAASGGVNSFFRNSCVAVSGANCYVVEYSGLPITGGASVYTSTNVNTATPGNVVFAKTYTWANSKHLHAVKVIGGVPWVTVGDGAQNGLYSDLGLWTATTTAANAWTRRSLYGQINNGTYEYGINFFPMTIAGQSVVVLEYDGYGPAGPLVHTTQDPLLVRPTRPLFDLPIPYTGSMQGLVRTSEGLLMWVTTSEGGAIGTIDSVWASPAPYTEPVLLETVAPNTFGSILDPIESGDFVWFGSYRVRKPTITVRSAVFQ